MSSQTFTLFASLPNELRQLVWRFSLPGAQTLVPFEPYNDGVFHTPNKAPKDHFPTALRITRESRAVALLHYSNWLNAAAFGWQYIDFSIDTICFAASDFVEKVVNRLYSPGVNTTLLRLKKADLWRITRVQIMFAESEHFGKDLKAWISRWLVVLFPGVRELEAVWYYCWAQMRVRPRSTVRDTFEKMVKDEVDMAREMGDCLLEEIEGKRGDNWKAPVLSVRWME
jgi:hypothetical protein